MKISSGAGKVKSGLILAIILSVVALGACGGGDDINSEVPVVDPTLFVHAAGKDFSVFSGEPAPFYCQGPTGTSYQWIVEINGGLPIDLTSYTTQRTTFVSPTVLTTTKVVLICRMTNGSAPVIDSKVAVTIQPLSPPIVVNPADYLRAAGQDFEVVSGATAPFYCQGPVGTAYQWIVDTNSGLPIDLSSYTAQRTSLVAPTVLTTTRVVLICRMTNGTAPVIDSKVTVTIQPSSPPIVVNPTDYVHAAGQDFDVIGGVIAPFYCQGPNGSGYQWVVENNGSLPIDLSSYNTQRTSFAAPVVTRPTPIVLSCRMTVNATTVISSRVTANVQPVPIAPTPTLTLVSSISGNRTVLPGQRLALTANTTWYDEKAVAVSGPLINYSWALGAGAPPGTVITPSTGSKDVEIVLPANIASAVYFPVTMTATSGNKASTSTISVLVDPSGDVNLSITPQAQTVVQGSVVSISATASSKLYYQWTIVSGTSVTLGGSTTNTVGFVAPSVPGEIQLRVAIGYSPITNVNPGVYFLESVVTVR